MCLIITSADLEMFPPRILALDGGGVRGLSSLLILREIMDEIGRQNNTGVAALPCEVFDMIGGTSTGGLAALMLGRLRMVPLLFVAFLTLAC
jgi:patatin-like phospholipase/acyl hydrolase